MSAKLPDNNGMIFLMPGITSSGNVLDEEYVDSAFGGVHRQERGDPGYPRYDAGRSVRARRAKLPITRSDSDQVAYALETNLHWFALNGIKPGDKITPPPSTLGPQRQAHDHLPFLCGRIINQSSRACRGISPQLIFGYFPEVDPSTPLRSAQDDRSKESF